MSQELKPQDTSVPEPQEERKRTKQRRKKKVCQIFRCTVLVFYAPSGSTVSLTCCRSCFCVFNRASNWKFRRYGGRFI